MIHRRSHPTPGLILLLPARNAEADLPGFLDHVETFVDAVVALDDGSTDRTRAILDEHFLVKILLENPVREGYETWNDAENRNRLLAAALALEPEWILSLDADERFDERDAADLRRFLETDGLPGVAYGFRHVPMRDDAGHFLPRYEWAYRLFAPAPGQRFREQKLHFAPIPTAIPSSRYVRTTLRIQHFGELTANHRLQRFAKYLQADPTQRYGMTYSSILHNPADLLKRPWEPRPDSMPVLLAEAQSGRSDGIALSVVVIAQNDEASIAASIAAIVEQECPEPFEVILVTSGSDRTAAIVRESFPGVRVVELPRPALPGEARNAGLRVARGTFVTFPGSHVTIAPGSLQARLRAHRRGYAMVTGVTENGTLTPAGWASYFLDHADGLPGQPVAEISGPPAHCSYARLPLLEVGGFPEGVRTAEDTAVNRALVQRGYVALRDPAIRFVHQSPCRTWPRLVRHHFNRGRGWGRLLIERHQDTGLLLNPSVIQTRLYHHVPDRLARIARGVSRADPMFKPTYESVRAGIAIGAFASWLGMWVEILRPAPAKWLVLTGQPHQTILLVPTGEPSRARIIDIHHARRQVTMVDAPLSTSAQVYDSIVGMGQESRVPAVFAHLTDQLATHGVDLVAGTSTEIARWFPDSSDASYRALWPAPLTRIRATLGIWRAVRGGRIRATMSAWQLANVTVSLRASTRSSSG